MRRSPTLTVLACLSVLTIACDDTVGPEPLAENRFRAEVSGAQSGVVEGPARLGSANLESSGRSGIVTMTGNLPNGDRRRLDLWFSEGIPEAGSYEVVPDWTPADPLGAGDVAVTFGEEESNTVTVTHDGRSGTVEITRSDGEVSGDFDFTVDPARTSAEGEFSFVGMLRVDVR